MSRGFGQVDVARHGADGLALVEDQADHAGLESHRNRVRYVPMTTPLANGLQRHRPLKGARVMCQKNGQPLRANMLAYLLERATRKAGARNRSQAAARGTARLAICSHLAMRGAPLRAVQELAGHRDRSTTQRYMHLSPSAIEGAIRLLERAADPREGSLDAPERGDVLETGQSAIENGKG